MKLKPGVRIYGMRPETLFAAFVADGVWQRVDGGEATMTSGGDGQHMRASKHYSGCAFDLRVCKDIATTAKAVRELAIALGADFDVLHESIGTANEHVHVEFDPKEAL